jgi:hypothetical protein
MHGITKFLCVSAIALSLVACAGKKHYKMDSLSSDNKIEQTDVTLEEGHFMGLSASRQNDDLAKMVVKSNNVNVTEFQKLEVLGKENLVLDQDTNKAVKENLAVTKEDLAKDITLLAMFEDMSRRQGTGEITLFFMTNVHAIAKGTENHTRLIRFLDDIAMKSAGRKVLFLVIGSASATGKEAYNAALSEKRANAPLGIIDIYWLNQPHEFYQIYGVGDSYSPKDNPKNGHRYQNVRIIAVYSPEQLPKVPAKK